MASPVRAGAPVPMTRARQLYGSDDPRPACATTADRLQASPTRLAELAERT